MLNNIPQVTKNLLLLNILMFVLTLFFETRGFDLGSLLGIHYFNSPLFEPYQIVTYFFMHGGVFHILFNMIALVMFGGFLENLWGPKRFFVLYIASAVGAIVLYNSIGFMQIEEIRQLIGHPVDLSAMDAIISQNGRSEETIRLLNEYLSTSNLGNSPESVYISEYIDKVFTPMVGASGAVFGIMAAFAILFPNTELQLIFPPIPVKAKYLIGGYFVFEIYNSIYQSQGDNVAHLAHVGGALVGGILVLIWRRKSTTFY